MGTSVHFKIRSGFVVPLFAAMVAMASAARAQSVQEISLPASQITGSWASGGCGTAVEKGTSSSGAQATMTWTDTTGAPNSAAVQIQIQAAWKFWCSGGSYTVSINGSSIGTGQVPTNSNNCLCNAAPYETTSQTITAGSFTWNANGSNSVSFNCTGASWIGVMDNSSGWSVRITVTLLNQPPFAPSNLHQAADSGGGAQPLGFVSDTTIYFRATVTDPDAVNTLGLQAEILPSTTAFGANPTGTVVATPSANFVAVGGVAEALLDFSVANLPSGSYHWRARTVDSFGVTGPWVVFNAAATHFTTDLVPPTTPGGPYSPSGVQFVMTNEYIGTVNFTWGAATDVVGPPLPVSYRFQVSVDQNFVPLLFEAQVPGTSGDATLTAAETLYYWRVFAIDAAGNPSAPSAAQPFQVSWTIPPVHNDRHQNCGVSMGGAPSWSAMLGVLGVILGMAVRRRSAR